MVEYSYKADRKAIVHKPRDQASETCHRDRTLLTEPHGTEHERCAQVLGFKGSIELKCVGSNVVAYQAHGS